MPIVVDDADFDERRKSIAQQLATTEQRLDCLFRATEEGPNMEHVRTYWINVQNAAIETRNLLINQVCGRIGRTLRESARDGDNLTPDEILKQVAEELFLVTPNNADITAESLYGQAYLKNKLGRIAEARELFEQCTIRFPEDPVAFNDLAWLELQTRSQRSAFQTARTNALRAVALAEAQNLSDLASYRDTLALAEIRLGNVEAGVKEIKKGIEKWAGLGRGPEPRFLETLMSAAEAYLAKGNREQAQVVLDFVLAENYANAKTAERIAEMQQTLAAPTDE
ncbi:MAG: hypothetical protein HYV60_02065 [Planctomycetia bacterium]|nr:hypothetical protein [Planctomycetia bacterium]